MKDIFSIVTHFPSAWHRLGDQGGNWLKLTVSCRSLHRS